MLAFESLTPQELLKEVAEYIRMEALRCTYVPAKTKLQRAMDESAANALKLVAAALEGAAIVPENSILRKNAGTCRWKNRHGEVANQAQAVPDTSRIAKEWEYPTTERLDLARLAGLTPFEADSVAHSRWEDIPEADRAKIEPIFNRRHPAFDPAPAITEVKIIATLPLAHESEELNQTTHDASRRLNQAALARRSEE